MTAEIKNLLEKAHISLLLDSYDALFSDFDPRPYNERALSDDFLAEVRRAIREAEPGVFEIRFLIQKHHKNLQDEEIIKDRLRHYFQKHAHVIEKQAHGILQKGILLAIMGFFFMFASSFIGNKLPEFLWLDFLRVIMEPAGWFLVWYGFDQIFYDAKSLKPELEFNHKMAKAEIHFDSY